MAETKITENIVEKVRIPMMDYTINGLLAVVVKGIAMMFIVGFIMWSQCTNDANARIENHTLEMIIVSTPYEKRGAAVAAMCPQKIIKGTNKKTDPELAICKTLIQLWGKSQTSTEKERE